MSCWKCIIGAFFILPSLVVVAIGADMLLKHYPAWFFGAILFSLNLAIAMRVCDQSAEKWRD